jgi:hypothetical protein
MCVLLSNYEALDFLESQAGRVALIIPTSSLVIDQSGSHVVTVQDGHTIHFAPVVIGRDMGTQVEVLSGIQSSDSLVASPSDLLHERQNVQVR